MTKMDPQDFKRLLEIAAGTPSQRYAPVRDQYNNLIERGYESGEALNLLEKHCQNKWSKRQ